VRWIVHGVLFMPQALSQRKARDDGAAWLTAFRALIPAERDVFFGARNI
jgi:hypothetical protein